MKVVLLALFAGCALARSGAGCRRLLRRPASPRRHVPPPSRAARSAISGSRASSGSSPRRSLLSRRAGRRGLGPERIDDSLKSLFATGLFADVNIDPRGQHPRRQGRREPDHQPHRLRGQQELDDKDLETEIQLRPRVVYTRTRVQNDVSRILELYRRHGRYRRDGRAQDHPARPEPRRSRVRDQRGPDHRRSRHQLHRQRAVQRQHAARRDRRPRKAAGIASCRPTTPTTRIG